MRFRIDPSDLTGPARVEVNVHPTVDEMRSWAAANSDTIEPGTCAYTSDLGPDHKVNVQIHFGADDLELSLVAHEATHAAFAAHHMFRDQFIDVLTHTEDIPEWVGNLTAVIWYSFDAEGLL